MEEHVVRCGRNNEASYGDTVVTGIDLESGGQLLQATYPNANNSMIRFEAIGDSITAGYKVTVPPGVVDPATIANHGRRNCQIRRIDLGFCHSRHCHTNGIALS